MTTTEVEAYLDRVVGALPGGSPRPPQVEMLRAVAGAIDTGEHVAVQGPTGVGKSLAYLVPVLDAATRGLRTVVVTATRALQDQLAQEDLPVAAAPFDDVSWAVLKGRNNYLCRAAMSDLTTRRDGTAELDLGAASEPTDRADPGEIAVLVEWAGRTNTGDRAELTDEPNDAAWSAVSVSSGECPGAARCDHAADCWSELAREAALAADVVVVNAHLYAAHLQSGSTLLGEHQVLVVDEAHEFEDALVGALGTSVGPGRLRAAARSYARLVAGDPGPPRALERAADEVEVQLRATLDELGGDRRATRLEGPLPEPLTAALADARIAVDAAIDGVASIRDAARQSGSTTARHRAERAARSTEGLADDLDAVTAELEVGQVRWVSESVTGRTSLELTRIDVADTLRRIAWRVSEDDGSSAPTVVMCSATLDPETPARLGLDARYVAVDSPFDVRNHGLLHVPRIPRPTDPRWPDAVVDELEWVVELLDGRTLGLFTSRRMLDRTAGALVERLPDRRILVQGDAPNPVLQREFLDDEHATLLATASFWTGISAPGPTCSAVVIDKLPFPVPSDPIVQARGELVGEARAFAEVSVPAAAVGLAQGAGRLLRTVSDRGIVVVLDPRLAEAGYRRRILDRLPAFRRTRDREDVRRFVEQLDLDA